MALGYLRPGGWPGVAGWEFDGMESPVILSAQVAIVSAAGPIAGMLLKSILGAVRRLSRRLPAELIPT
jgi:hypothetical protein